MKLNNEAREILDRYLLGVKRKLTGKEREDITNEIESHILDTLAEQNPKAETIGKDELVAVLTGMGAPHKVAWQYTAQRSLVGPRLYPIYLLVLKILVGVVVGALTLSTIITTVLGEQTVFWRILLDYIGAIWSGGLAAAGIVTLIFAIIERATEEKVFEDMEEFEELKEMNEFKLNDLPELPESEKKFDRVGTIFEVVFGIIGLAFFTYLQNTGGLLPAVKNPGSDVRMIRFFTESYMQLVPVILAISALEVGQAITLLVQGYHSQVTNWWKIMTEFANIVLMGFLLKAMPIITLNAFGELFNSEGLSNLGKLANTGLTIAMVLGIIGTVVDVIRRIVQEIRNPSY